MCDEFVAGFHQGTCGVEKRTKMEHTKTLQQSTFFGPATWMKPGNVKAWIVGSCIVAEVAIVVGATLLAVAG